MASQQPSPAQGPSSTAANAKGDKAKKWAAFRAQNYDGEGWGDEYGGSGGSPPHPPAPAQQEVPPSTSADVAGFASSLPPSVVSNLASAQNGSRSSLPSQVTNPRMSTDLTRGIVVSGGTGSSGVKRTEGRDSPNRRSWVEQRSSSPKPTGPGSDAPTTPIPEADESSSAPSNKRFSRSPQLPDLARMSMFGDDLFKSPASDEPPPPMPSLPSGMGGAGLGVKQADATEGAVASPTASAAQQTPPQITSASPSPPPAAPAESQASSGDTAAQNSSAATQSDSAADSNIPQKTSVSSPVFEGTKTPDSQHAAPTLNPSGIAGDVAPAESTSNVSSLNDPSPTDLTRELSPSPLRSMSPAEPAVSGDGSARGDASAGATSPVKQASANGDASEPAPQTTADKKSSRPRQSDLLREEIIKSLGRAAKTGQEEEEEEEATAHQRQNTQDSGTRESTYLPSVYDDYWEATAEDNDNAAPEVPSLPSGAAEEAAIAPLRPSSKSPGTASPQPLRKRFSWEQSSEAEASSPTAAQPQQSEAPAEPPTDAARSPVAGSSSPQSGGQGTPRLTVPEDSDSDEAEADVTRNESQFSKATAVDPDYVPKRLSLAAEKEMMEGSTEHLPTEPVEDHPALRDSPKDSHDSTPRASPKLSPKRESLKPVSFREIMALGTSRERVAKFNETRLQYAGMDQGLNSWIITLKAQPEHAGASNIFNTNGLDVPVNAPGAKGQPQSPTAAGQPYYQQYLNASSANAGAPGRSASAGLGSAASASAFKHGSNQAGVKSKELLLAAGKAGKGLLSKGKYKLRGSTSDKNESSAPQAQSKGQPDRSASLGVKLGAVASSPAPPVQQPQSAPTSPNAISHNPLATQRPPNGLPPLQPPPAGVLSGNPELVSPVDSDTVSRLSSEDGVVAPQGSKVGAPTTHTFLPWSPVMASPLAEGERSGDTAGGATHGGAGATGGVKGDDRSDDWIVVSPQLPSAQAQFGENHASKPETASQGEEVFGTDVAGQEAMDKSGQPRRSSFAGLPAIRRSSTFEPAFGEKAKDEIGEDSDDEDKGARLAQEGQADKLPTIVDVRYPTSPLESPSKDTGDAKPLEGQTRGNDETGDAAAPASGNDMPAADQQSLPAPGPGLGRNLPEHMKANPLQSPPPHGQWNLQESYLSEPLISPSRKKPASLSPRTESFTELDKETGGQASVNTAESSDNGSSSNNAGQEATMKASEPQGTATDGLRPEQRQPSPAYSAEHVGAARGPPLPVRPDEGAPALPARPDEGAPALPARPDERGPAPSAKPRPGPKFGITPPVSMQRYRGLFASKQQPQPAVYGQPGQPPPSQSHPNLAECSSALPDSAEPRPQSSSRPRSSSRPPTADGRRGSGIFTQIGERFAKMNTQGEPAGGGEEAAPAPEQRHRRRSSFFLNLKKGETQQGPKSGDSDFANPPSTLEDRSQASPSPEEPPKRSFFGVGKGRTSTGGSARFIPAMGRSSTGTPEGDAKEGKPRFIPAFSRSSTSMEDDGKEGKPRFGGLGRFRRTGTSDGPPEKPGTSGSMASSILSRPGTGASVQQGAPVPNVQPQGAGDPASLPLPATRGRSGTTGSVPGVSSPLAQDTQATQATQATAPPEERGRKISGPGAFLSNIWHTRSPSRSKEGKLPKPSVQPQLGPGGLPLGMAPAQQNFARPPSSGKPQTPVHQRRASAPSPAGSPSHQRQMSVPEQSSPLSRRSATVESTSAQQQTEQGQPPEQSTIPPTAPQSQVPSSPSQANQAAGKGPQMQDWRPVPVQQGAEGVETTENAALASQVSEGASVGDGVKAGPVTKPDAPSEVRTSGEGGASLATPTKSSEDVEAKTDASHAEMTPKAEKPPSIREPSDKKDEPSAPSSEPNNKVVKPNVPSIREPDAKDAEPSVPSISEPPKASSPTPSSRSAASQHRSPPPEEDRIKTPQQEGPPASSSASATSVSRAPTSSGASFESTPSRSQGGVSVAEHPTGPAGEQTPRASSPAMSQGQGLTVSSPTQSRVSVGQTVSPVAFAAGAPAQLAPQGPPPQGQLPQVPGQVPGQPAPGQQVQGQPVQGGPQGQWRPFVPGQQMPPGPTPPGFQGQPAPTQAPSTSASQHSNSPVQLQPVPSPQGQQPGQGQSGVSKWFKGIASSQQQQGQQPQSVQGKAKSLFGALKRSSKPGAPKPPAAQPQVAQPGQQGQPGFAPVGYPQHHGQPQHGQPQFVMHPQWGMVPVTPYQYGPVLQPGQQMQAGHPLQPGQQLLGGHPLQPGQQFVQAPFPGAFQPMPYTTGQAPFQSYAPNQAQGHSAASSRQPSVASNQPHSATSPSGSPAVQGPGMVPAQPAATGPPQSTGVVAPHPMAAAGPQAQGATGPQPSENRGPAPSTNKPLPVPTLVSPESQAAPPPTTEASKTVAALEQAARSSSLGQGAYHSRDGSHASPKPEGAGSLNVDTEAAKRESGETNLYDATPRGDVAGSEGTSSTSPAAASREDMKASAEPATQSTEPASQPTQPATQSTEATSQSTQESTPAPSGESRQQEMIRKMRREAQDEKILVPGQEGLPGAEEEHEDPDKPKMSATSYPGQEWNPYGGYEFYYD